jgi:predicted DNA-binding transcriptional regulator YafY
MLKYGLWEWGTLSRIARELSVSRATVCRDRQALERWW